MPRITHAVLGAAVAAAAIAPASAQAAETNSFGCSANALRLTALGLTIEPAVAKQGAVNCVDENRSLLRLPSNIPLLYADAVPAATVSGEPNTGKQTANSTAGIANARVKPLPSIPQVGQLLNQLVGGVQPIEVPLVGTIDIRQALVGLLGERLDLAPDLLSVGVTNANAVASYDSKGKVQFKGESKVADVKLLGTPVALTDSLDRVVNLIDTANIDLGALLPLNQVRKVGPLASGNQQISRSEEPRVRQAVREAQQRAQAQGLQLIPPALARVKLAANQQEKTADRLTQRALTAHVSLLNQPLLDAVIGEATVTGKDRAEDPLLACTTRRLVLTDVYERKGRVKLEGVADPRFVGKTVGIYFQADGKRVATAKVNKDRGFTTTASLPRKDLRATNKARYQARIGKDRSFNLKLQRRMVVTDTKSADGKVTFTGRVTKPLTKPPTSITVKRRLSCKKWERVGTIKPSSSGSFKLTVKAPPKTDGAVVYRLSSRVHKNTTNKKTYPTYTLPLGVNIKY